MTPSSSDIKYPARYRGPAFSENNALTGESVLISILNALGKVVDLVRSCRGHSHVQIDKEQGKRFCHAVVTGANGFTKQFNTAVAMAKKRSKNSRYSYTDLFTRESRKFFLRQI